jgi:hypothetical protein
MSLPDYLICLECDTPCYTFEWRNDKPYDIQCQACGNEELELFVRPDEVDELDLDWNRRTSRSRGREEETPTKGGSSRREET